MKSEWATHKVAFKKQLLKKSLEHETFKLVFFCIEWKKRKGRLWVNVHHTAMKKKKFSCYFVVAFFSTMKHGWKSHRFFPKWNHAGIDGSRAHPQNCLVCFSIFSWRQQKYVHAFFDSSFGFDLKFGRCQPHQWTLFFSVMFKFRIWGS